MADLATRERQRPAPRVPTASTDPAEAAFAAYTEAARQAQNSLSLRDGIEAGRRWGAFVRIFEGNGQ